MHNRSAHSFAIARYCQNQLFHSIFNNNKKKTWSLSMYAFVYNNYYSCFECLTVEREEKKNLFLAIIDGHTAKQLINWISNENCNKNDSFPFEWPCLKSRIIFSGAHSDFSSSTNFKWIGHTHIHTGQQDDLTFIYFLSARKCNCTLCIEKEKKYYIFNGVNRFCPLKIK